MPTVNFGYSKKFVSTFYGVGVLASGLPLMICQNVVIGGYITSIEECIVEQTDGVGKMLVWLEETTRPGVKKVWYLGGFGATLGKEYRLSEIVGNYLKKSNGIVLEADSGSISYRYILTMECIGTGYNY